MLIPCVILAVVMIIMLTFLFSDNAATIGSASICLVIILAGVGGVYVNTV